MITTTTTLRFAVLLTVSSGFLDSYTFLVRGGVFANAQTGNVIFLGINLSEQHWHEALGHLWPILAFFVGVTLSTHIKSGRLDRMLPHPIRWTIGIQVLILAIIGFVPQSVPNIFVTVAIAFMAAMQLGLFRSIGDLNYIAIATTGNLMRFVEAGYTGFVDKDHSSRDAFRTYGKVIAAFAGGAVIGAIATQIMDVRAVWLPAVFLAVTLVFFVIDEREKDEPTDPGPGRD